MPDRSLFRRVQAYLVDEYREGAGKWLGRQLYRLLHEAGLENLLVVPVLIPYTSLAQANSLIAVLDVADDALSHGGITAEEHARWHGWLRDADAAGSFFAALGGFTVIGTKA